MSILRPQSFLAKNTVWMTFGFAGRLLFLVAYFLIVARTLQSAEYGAFAGALALVTVFSPFVSWGTGNILIEHVSRQPDQFKNFWGMALSVTLLSSFVLLIICFGTGALILSPAVAVRLILPLALGMFLGDGITNLSGQAFQSFQKLGNTSIINFLSGLFRLISAILLLFLPILKSAQNWAILYMLSGFVPAMIGLIWVRIRLGWGSLRLSQMRGKWKEGFYFAVGLSAQGVYNDIDKTLLVRLSTDVISGVYSAAYRIMDATFIPVRALLASTYPRFFKKGENGIKETSSYALRLLPWTCLWGLVAMVGIILLSPLIPRFLGIEYSESSHVILWLSLIPLFRAGHYLAADSLTGAGYQSHRSLVQIAIAILNLALNLWLIPIYGWLGAAWSSLASDGILVICLWGLNFIFAKRMTARESIDPIN